MLPREQEQQQKAWHERRAQEIVGPAPKPAGKSISEDGLCLVCRDKLVLMERQPQHGRDWAQCFYCGNSMPVVEGVLQ